MARLRGSISTRAAADHSVLHARPVGVCDVGLNRKDRKGALEFGHERVREKQALGGVAAAGDSMQRADASVVREPRMIGAHGAHAAHDGAGLRDFHFVAVPLHPSLGAKEAVTSLQQAINQRSFWHPKKLSMAKALFAFAKMRQ